MTELFVFQSALKDFLRLKRVFVWLFVATGLFLISKVYLRVTPDANLDESYSMMSSLLVFRVLPLGSAIFSTAVISQEVEQKTIVYLLTRPIDRWKLVSLRSLASAVAVFLVTSFAALSVSSAVFSNPFANSAFLRDLVAIFVGSLAYGALFVYVTLLISKAAMVVCLFFAFAWETSVPNMSGSMALLSVNTYLSAIAQRPSSGNASGGFFGTLANNLGTSDIATSTGWIVMALMIAFLMGVSMWWFSTFEYVPREDAG